MHSALCKLAWVFRGSLHSSCLDGKAERHKLLASLLCYVAAMAIERTEIKTVPLRLANNVTEHARARRREKAGFQGGLLTILGGVLCADHVKRWGPGDVCAFSQ